ncbi:MAG: DUF4399 domain-containing protein [Actinomycetota bacterium]
MKKSTIFMLVALVAMIGCNKASLDKTTADTGASSPSPAPKPYLHITSPAPGDSIAGNTVELGVEHAGVRLAKADGDTSGASGHFHVFIDRDAVPVGAVIPKSNDILHTTDDPMVITGLSIGVHTLTVVFGDGAHTRITDAIDTIRLTTNGPSIKVAGPASIVAGQTLRITVAVTGMTLVKSPQGQAPKSGHLHVLIDLQLPGYAKAIEATNGIIHTTDTTIDIKGLNPGEHLIYVVVGDGGHVPFRPLVADRLVVTVT